MKTTLVQRPLLKHPPRGLFRQQYPFLNAAWLALDVFVTVATLLVLVAAWHGEIPERHRVVAVVLGLVMLPIYQWSGLFEHVRTRSLLVDLGLLLRAFLLTISAMLGIGLITGTLDRYQHEFLLPWIASAFVAQTATHLGVRAAMLIARRHAFNIRRALLVGTGPMLKTFPATLARNPWLGIEVIGYLETDKDTYNGAVSVAGALRIPRLGDFDDLSDTITAQAIDVVYLLMPMEQTALISKAARRLLEHSVDVAWVPDLSAFLLIGHGIRDIEGHPVLALSESPMNGLQRMLKRILDLAGASLLLLLLSPLLLLVAVLVKVTSPGPVLYRQPRHGINGKRIVVWKFRSMYTDHERAESPRQVRPHDPGVTPVGRLLRRWSIDELPQLIQVLAGTMSLVGPRPHPIWLNERFQDLMEGYMQRHRVKPGLTGWAQVNGWRGETASVEKMEMRLRHDIYYIQHWSIWFDLRILLMTPFAVTDGRNAF